jgi:hypothetical protein
MRTWLFVALVSCVLGSGVALADAPRSYDVPRVSEVQRDLPTHEVILPADIVMRAGETPQQAIARALHGDRDRRAGKHR